MHKYDVNTCNGRHLRVSLIKSMIAKAHSDTDTLV